MFLPAAALALAALAAGIVPGVADAMLQGASRFVDGGSYARAVLAGAPAAPVAPGGTHSPPAHAYLLAASTLAASLALAALSLFPPRRMTAWARLGTPWAARLRALHSGHVGDYVAWLVAGFTALGGAFALALT